MALSILPKGRPWIERYQAASFRGAEFFVESSGFSTGRHTVQHEFPEREVPFAEDVGKKSDSFAISGHILGDDYFELRDKLIAACQKKGVGTLIHPYLGSKQVHCSDLSITEDWKQGRICTFSATFIEAGEFRFPTIASDKRQSLADFAGSLLTQSDSIFATIFDVASQPQHVVDAAAALVNDAAVAMDEVAAAQNAANQGIADFAFATRNLIATASTLINTPAQLAAEMGAALDLLFDAFDSDNDRLSAFRGLKDFGALFPIIPQDTPTNSKKFFNQKAMTDFIHQNSIARSAETAADSEFFTRSDGIIVRDDILDSINGQQQDSTIGDEFFQTLDDVSAGLVETVPDPNQDFADIIEFTPVETVPSIVMLYDLFESLENEQDLIDRNAVRHPGFVPGGVELEVLEVI